jgi:hypothetical protein
MGPQNSGTMAPSRRLFLVSCPLTNYLNSHNKTGHGRQATEATGRVPNLSLCQRHQTAFEALETLSYALRNQTGDRCHWPSALASWRRPLYADTTGVLSSGSTMTATYRPVSDATDTTAQCATAKCGLFREMTERALMMQSFAACCMYLAGG